MILKLRRKFILVIMSVVTVLMISAFVGILIFTSRNMQQQTAFALDSALKSISMISPDGDKPGDRRMPALTVITDENGTIISQTNQIFNLPDSDVADIIKQALETGDESGILRDYSLRFMIRETPFGETHLAFVDISTDKSIIEDLLLSSALIGLSALLVFFGVSVLLARWIVRPVEKAWNSQRQFVADASHELKTPLTVVLSNVEMLSGDARIQDKKTLLRLENILEEARHMKLLVDDLLQLARSDSIENTVIPEKVDFSTLVNNAVLIFEPILYDAGKRFEYSLENGLFVSGGPIRLRRLTEIILDNACKYSTPKSLISVVLKRSIGKNEVCFEVTNDSETIPKEELPLVFERFYRRDKARSSGGYGLGLSIAINIVREHGGKIFAKSDSGQTTFTVLFPSVR